MGLYESFQLENSIPCLWGMEVVFSKLLTDTVMEYPKDRWIEYGPEDDHWLKQYGWPKAKQVPSKSAYVVEHGKYTPFAPGTKIGRGAKLVLHPDTFTALKAELDRREAKHRSIFESEFGKRFPSIVQGAGFHHKETT